jgi:hypothetical protein
MTKLKQEKDEFEKLCTEPVIEKMIADLLIHQDEPAEILQHRLAEYGFTVEDYCMIMEHRIKRSKHFKCFKDEEGGRRFMKKITFWDLDLNGKAIKKDGWEDI